MFTCFLVNLLFILAISFLFCVFPLEIPSGTDL